MRTIKFRAWDKEFNIMTHFNLTHGDSYGLGGDIFPQYEIMQYTGLLDKNGKEIYEGDIFTDEDDNKRWEVVFENAEFFGKLLKGIGERSISIRTNELTVIGNIYEGINN